MTLILSTIVIAVLLSYFFYKPIHKFRYILYVITGIISILLFEEANIVTLGFVPLGLFMIIMLSGVLSKGTLRKRLFMVRAELAVVATLLLLPHAIGFGEFFLSNLDILYNRVFMYFGVIAAILIIPLFVTSFRFVRKYMNYKQWKTLHYISYVVYLFIALHLILMQNERMFIYILVFSTYGFLKVLMIYQKKAKKVVKVQKVDSQ